MLIRIVSGQAFGSGSLEEVIICCNERKGRELCLGQHAVQRQGGCQLHGVVTAQVPKTVALSQRPSLFDEQLADGLPGDGNRGVADIQLLRRVWPGYLYLARGSQNLEKTFPVG